MSEWKNTPSSSEIADSLLALAQDIEIGKEWVAEWFPPFLREAADRMSRQALEIERLREALYRINGQLENVEAAMVIAIREAEAAVGDESTG